MAKITVQNTEITVVKLNDDDYISLTNIALYKSDDPTAVIGNWMRNRNTIEYLGIWETLYNPNFNPLEFEGFRREAGLLFAAYLCEYLFSDDMTTDKSSCLPTPQLTQCSPDGVTPIGEQLFCAYQKRSELARKASPE